MRFTLFLFSVFVYAFTTGLLWNANPDFHPEWAKTAIYITRLIKGLSGLYIITALLGSIYRTIKQSK